MSHHSTLIELCGLETKGELDGVSLVPLLQNPNAAWDRPALMTYQRVVGSIPISPIHEVYNWQELTKAGTFNPPTVFRVT